MRKTIRNVTIVVPVLITSCHVLLKLKIGPVNPHTTMIPQARTNAVVVPVHRVTTDAVCSSHGPSPFFLVRATIARSPLQHPVNSFHSSPVVVGRQLRRDSSWSSVSAAPAL